MLEQSPTFINPWDSQNYSTTTCDLGIDDDLKNNLPYRRHSLAQEQPVLRGNSSNNNTQRQTSWNSMSSFSSNSSDLFGSIWNSNNNNNIHTNGATTSSSYSSPHLSSSTSPTSSFTRSFPTTQDSLPLPFRRFSLAPITYETNQDQVNALSSVPEEPYQTYRRHSLAGPLISTPSSSLPSPLLSSSIQHQQQHHLLSNYHHPHSNHAKLIRPSATTSSNNGNSLLSRMQEENELLPFELLTSVERQGSFSLDPPVSWCMVEFKAGRAEIYYSSCPVNQDDWVIVEADRGRDLGKVVAKDLPLDQVQLLLAATSNSSSSATTTTTTTTNSPSTTNSSFMTNIQSSQSTSVLISDHPPSPSASSSSTSSSSSSCSSLPLPKQICRLATPSEITLLVTKRHDEQKALLICQTKSKQKNLLMDIVDAEYQWDRRKLTFYFIAERRVDFRELVRDLFKIYKTRIWMCSVNSLGKKNMASVNG